MMENWKKLLYCYAFAFAHIEVLHELAKLIMENVNIMRWKEKCDFIDFMSEYNISWGTQKHTI